MTTPQILTSHLGTLLFAALIYAGWLLRVLSRRLGEVTKMRRYYRWFDLGNVLVAMALLVYIIECSVGLIGQPNELLRPEYMLPTFYLPLLAGLTTNLVVAAIYWRWLLNER